MLDLLSVISFFGKHESRDSVFGDLTKKEILPATIGSIHFNALEV